MIHEIDQIEEIGILHIDRLVLDNLQFAGDHLEILVLDIINVIEKSIPIEFHRVQNILIFIANEETLDLLTIHLSEILAIVLFVDPTQEGDSTLQISILHIKFHQDHVFHLRLHL